MDLSVVLPNSLDALQVILECASFGVIFSSTAPDKGASGVIDRYRQLKPPGFICQTQITYGGKTHDFRGEMSKVYSAPKTQVPELETCVVAQGSVFAGDSV